MHITVDQMRRLDQQSFDRYLVQLGDLLARPAFKEGTSRALANFGPGANHKLVAERLVAQARELGFTAEGDVTPFCLLMVYDYPRFRSHPCIDWIRQIINDKTSSPEARLDAVFALLSEDERREIFP